MELKFTVVGTGNGNLWIDAEPIERHHSIAKYEICLSPDGIISAKTHLHSSKGSFHHAPIWALAEGHLEPK